MGYENRDYVRDHSGGESGWGYSSNSGGVKDWEVWKKLIALNVIVFLLQIFITRPAALEDLPGFDQFDEDTISEYGEYAIGELGQISTIQKWFELDSEKILHGQIWRIVTCGFCHDRNSMWHLFMNMLLLFYFGKRLEYQFGSKEFCAFYFASLLVASFFYIALDLYTGTLIPAIGASGAVWGIVALYALMYPYETIRVNFLFPMQIRFVALMYFLFDLHPVLLALSGEQLFTGVGHAAHVGGAVFGFLYWKFGWLLMPWIEGFTGNKQRWSNSRQQTNGHQRVIPLQGPYKKFNDEQDEKMDAVLAKISNEGRESLTEQEEKFLLEQSERMRNR